MATKRFSEAPAAADVLGAEEVVGLQGGVTKRIPLALTLVNDLTTGGTAKGLTAQMGKALKLALDAALQRIGVLEAASSTAAPNYAFTSTADASRFLRFGTWGVNDAEITNAMTLGSMDAWVTDQLSRANTPMLTYYDANVGAFPTLTVSQAATKKYITDTDQLRHRVAFALSEFVVASSKVLVYAEAMVVFADLFHQHAFGNFRTFIEAVFKSPVMGTYLTYYGNPKATGSSIPDQNGAREFMQLFTIGLVQLNIDGTPALVNGQPVETYGNADVAGLASVFTGWGGADGVFSTGGNPVPIGTASRNPMIQFPAQHELGTKTFLGVTIPANTAGQASLTIALDTLFNHANCGPFVAKNLIIRLTTSTPKPAYVARVAAKFNNNGSGVRGDMQAVIRAILLDVEVVNNRTASAADWGRLINPIQRMVGILRNFEAVSASNPMVVSTGGLYGAVSDGSYLGMEPWGAPSVFGFNSPTYSASAAAAAIGLATPELTQMGPSGLPLNLGQLTYFAQNGSYFNRGASPVNNPVIPFTKELALGNAPAAIVDRCILLMAGGQMPAATRTAIINEVTLNASRDAPYGIVSAAMIAVGNSPDAMVQT